MLPGLGLRLTVWVKGSGCGISSTQVDVVGKLHSCNHGDNKRNSVKGGGTRIC